MGFFEIMTTITCCLCVFYCLVVMTIIFVETIIDRVNLKRKRKRESENEDDTDKKPH